MLPRRALVPLLLALASPPLFSTSAWAQPSDADRSTARGLATEGLAALGKKDYVTAADRLSRAEGILHAPTHLLGLARAQVGLGRWVSAQETYLRIVREGAPSGAPAPFVKAVEEAQKELDALAPRVPSLVVQVTGTTTAAVLIDGAPLPGAALGVKRPVDPGQHVVRATADGFAPAEATVMSNEGKSDSVTLDLKAAAGGTVKVPIAPAADPGAGRRIGGIVAISVGGALITVGAVMLALQLTQCDPTNPDNITCFNENATSAPQTFGIVSGVMFGTGVAAATAGIVLLATLPKAAAKAAVVPVISPGFTGIRGSF
jgi:hypothetical protein